MKFKILMAFFRRRNSTEGSIIKNSNLAVSWVMKQVGLKSLGPWDPPCFFIGQENRPSISAFTLAMVHKV